MNGAEGNEDGSAAVREDIRAGGANPPLQMAVGGCQDARR